MKLSAVFTCAVAAVVAMQASALSTQIVNDSWGPFGSVQHFELKNGGSTWELARKSGGSVLANINIPQSSPVTYRFDLSHDANTGDVTLELDGGNTIWSMIWQTGEAAFGELHLLAKVSPTTAGTEEATFTALELSNNGGPATALSPIGANSNLTKQYLRIYDEVFTNFSLTGSVTLAWSAGAPNAAAEGFFGWSDPRDVEVVPTPAAGVAGLSLLSLMALRRRRNA